MNQQLQVQIEIPEQALSDLLTTAWEGGSDYWTPSYDAQAHRRGGEPNIEQNQLDVMSIEFHTPTGDDDCPEPVKLAKVGTNDIGFAIAKVLNGEVKVGDHIKRDLANNIREVGACDADTADVLLQVATFGEVVYG